MTTTVIPAPTLADQPIEQVAVNTIRTLCMNAVQAANSGHPGTPMALAPGTYTLWQQFLRADPAAPIWSNRAGSCSPPDTPPPCCTPCCT